MSVKADDVLRLLRSHRYQAGNERDLQEALLEVLSTIPGCERERIISPQDRLDFLLPGGIGVEVKIEGSLSALTRQLHRYAQRPEISALIVVTTQRRLARVPPRISGKHVHVVMVGEL